MSLSQRLVSDPAPGGWRCTRCAAPRLYRARRPRADAQACRQREGSTILSRSRNTAEIHPARVARTQAATIRAATINSKAVMPIHEDRYAARGSEALAAEASNGVCRRQGNNPARPRRCARREANELNKKDHGLLMWVSRPIGEPGRNARVRSCLRAFASVRTRASITPARTLARRTHPVCVIPWISRHAERFVHGAAGGAERGPHGRTSATPAGRR